MLFVKLIVLILYSKLFNVYCVNYCKICVNHTLCLFPSPGPDSACKGYRNTSLTNYNIKDIVNRINEKRNFISMGLSKYLPQAANMRKMSWSNRLASFAQRWADRCDQTVYWDREDYCRDLGDDVRVGQNIATILGSTSRLNVKSFVDMWYMQLIDYTGSVTFYNQSHDQKAHYFTQLIWADSNMVGCGRATFQIIDRNVTADRLVCNFAPKGNIHGKPVYVIGFPATQCAKQTEADSTFPGLCQYTRIRNKNEGKFTTQRPPVSSLLRILNLSNSSVKQEIDPIRSNLTQIYYGRNKTSEQRNQKIRHVLLNNNTLDGVKRMSSVKSQKFWKNLENRSRHNMETFYHADRGHSRMYHGYQTHIEHFDSMHKNNDEDFRKYDFTTEPMTISTDIDNDLRKYNIHNNRCTRKMDTGSNCCSTERSDTNNCHINKCTRSKCPHTTHVCQTTCPSYTHKIDKPLHNVCPCNKQTTMCQNPLSCNCNLNCQCLSTEIYTRTPFPNYRRSEDIIPESQLKPLLNKYDIAPNLAQQNIDRKFSGSSSYNTRIFNTDIENYSNKQVYGRKLYQNHGHQKNLDEFLKLNNHPTPEQDYNVYDFLGPNQRKKRENIDHVTFRPFWQVDQFNNENTLNLKSIRYTTLANRKNKKTRRTATSIKSPAVTEAITIKLKELSTVKNEQGRVSEKYLSFDELMHIRKMSTLEIGYDARRKSNETNILREDKTTPAVTTIATIETPFARKKHCTRKLTCTWTAFTATGSDGNIILPGGGGNYGSKTPPGYVDGCTRTSTCTRDFQERNKFSTIPDPTSIEPSPEDEDYCEKRSLNVYRRDSNDKKITDISVFSVTESYDTTKFLDSQEYVNNVYKTTRMSKIGCYCGREHSRIKREEFDHWKSIKNTHNSLSYGDLYYLIVEKIIKSWKDNKHLYKPSKCSCNTANISSLHIYTLFLIIYGLN